MSGTEALKESVVTAESAEVELRVEPPFEKAPVARASAIEWLLSLIVYFVLFYGCVRVSGVLEALMSYSGFFRFHFGETALSDPWIPAIITSIYVLFVLLAPRILRSRRALSLRPFTAFHNVTLSLLSLALLGFMSRPIARGWLQRGWYHALCSTEFHDDSVLHMSYFLNYFLKYYEFLDTVLLVLKKKPVQGLHFYHHAITLVLTYTQQLSHSTVQWVPISINLFVHVFMYWYYFLTSLGVHGIWWKRSLTVIQIVQFIVDLAVCWLCWILIHVHPQSCNSTEWGAASGVAIISSYLVLFLGFYSKTYRDKGAKSD